MKYIIATIFMLSSIILNAQRSWSLELGVGNHTIADEFVDVQNNYYHLDGVVRYNFNERFGLGIFAGYDNLGLYNVKQATHSNVDYYRASLEGVVDVFELLHLDNGFLTVQTHGGFGFGKQADHIVPNFRGGVAALVRLSPRFALKGDFSTT